LENTFWKKT